MTECALAFSIPAYAQQCGTAQSQQQANQVSQCLESLLTLARRMNEGGYRLAGYSGYGVDAFGNLCPSANC